MELKKLENNCFIYRKKRIFALYVAKNKIHDPGLTSDREEKVSILLLIHKIKNKIDFDCQKSEKNQLCDFVGLERATIKSKSEKIRVRKNQELI
jgi:hypothetical protein